jgi:hypothetical protein
MSLAEIRARHLEFVDVGCTSLQIAEDDIDYLLSLLDEARGAGLKLWNTAAWPSAEAGRVSVDMHAWDEWAESLRRLEE